jgi:pimeloyl-ACP methyl ester carboxylesterase
VSAYENGRFAQSTQYVWSYPEQLPLLRDVPPEVRVPVRVFGATDDPLVPLANARYLAERVTSSELTVLTAGHFAGEEVPGPFASTWWLAARFLPERRKNGTPAHRQLSISARTAARVSVPEPGATPGSSR